MAVAADFSGDRALGHLRKLAAAANSAPETSPDGTRSADPLHLEAALRATGADTKAEPLPDAPLLPGPLSLRSARIPGRFSGPPWVLCTPSAVPGLPDAPWYPNADGSGVALLLALLECLAAAPPEHDVLALLLPTSLPHDEGLAAAEAWASRPLLPLRGVFAVWQVAAPGMLLDLDVRTLGQPAARAHLEELFLLGRALGLAAFAGGAQTAFPGPHVPFLERGLPAVPLCAASDLLAGSADDTLAHCDATSLHAVGAALVRFLRGERAA